MPMRFLIKKLPLIILIALVLVAFLVVLPFSSGIMQAVKHRFAAVSHTIVTAQSHDSAVPASQSTSSAGALGALISRDVPAFASSATYPALNANDQSYDTSWRSSGAPAWLTYDLSSVPAAKRGKVLVAWYNGSGNYNHTLIKYPAYNLPQDYTLDVNAAAGGGSAPANGWVTLVTVKGNHYHSRQHIVTMTGYNWLRINITAIDGSAENTDASINMDVYDASVVLDDDWIFYGDSITAGAMGQETLNNVPSFAQLINARVPNDYPVQEGGGTGYLTSADGAHDLNTWLGFFPGKYVGLSYGTNDALGCVDPDTFYNNYVAMVQDVLQTGEIPLVPSIPWGRNASIQRCAPALNAQIERLYAAFPQVVHGPNLWNFFQSHQNLISSDDIHPNQTGFAAYRQQWADTVLTEVYSKK